MFSGASFFFVWYNLKNYSLKVKEVFEMSGPVYYKDVKYSVCWHDGKNTLLRMDNLHNKGDVLIPKKLPDGREIDAIARNFCPGGLCGHFSKSLSIMIYPTLRIAHLAAPMLTR